MTEAAQAPSAPDFREGMEYLETRISRLVTLWLPLGIADAMEAPSLDDLTDPMQRMFRAFAEQTKSDLRALAACIRGTRQTLSAEQVGRISTPTLISVGTRDEVSGSGPELAKLIPDAESFAIEGRDHNLAVGDKSHKQAVLDFLARL